MSSVAGALEPCGCVKDMLGGADHAAAYVAAQAGAAPNALTVGAGPMLFLNSKPDASHDTQSGFKADALADAYKALHLSAWAPGANDWLLGEATLAKLVGRSGATLLGANLKGPEPSAHQAGRGLGSEGRLRGLELAAGLRPVAERGRSDGRCGSRQERAQAS